MLTVKDSQMADNNNNDIETLIQSTTSGHPPELKNLNNRVYATQYNTK